ncbi:hypothetical protein Leryth_008092 [Lithospermum erythrorhizon]|nr:hypothetical protein Leryth_008092 [Lithospermum erythrorhizon]
MVLGVKSKKKKGIIVRVDYIVHVQEIRPWPPSDSLRSVESVLLQWENGEQNSGFLTANVEDDIIEFNKSFTVFLTLRRDKKDPEKLHKNYMEFFLYESPKEMADKGQLLGTVLINFADFGIIQQMLTLSFPLNCKKSSKGLMQPSLSVKIQPSEESLKEAIRKELREPSAPYGALPRLSSMIVSTDNGPSKKSKLPERSMSFQKVPYTPSVESTLSITENSGYLNRQNLRAEFAKDNVKKEYQNDSPDKQVPELTDEFIENILVGKDAIRRQSTMKSIKSILGGVQLNTGRLKHTKSVQIKDASNITGILGGGWSNGRVDKEHVTGGSGSISKATPEKKESRKASDGKKDTESKVEVLEDELKEAAAIEFGLYSVSAEHGSSRNKLHAPARRLSRLYFHASSARSAAKLENASRAAVSGLIVVTKACGNDVTRLTFWLSNIVMLRSIVSQARGGFLKSGAGGKGQSLSDGKHSDKKFDASNKSGKKNVKQELSSWEDIDTFITALETIEAWIFSRIVKSVWWQTFTPRMHPPVSKTGRRNRSSRSKKSANPKKSSRSKPGLGDQEQSKCSVKLWKKAFKDACEKLCPIRTGGHHCGCLPLLSKLVMEQLLSKLDVAMFNAILRESGEGMATDPVSDPITDINSLPIPSGKSSFGAGAQLKNAIQNWSKYLTDLLDIEDHGSQEIDVTTDGNPPSSLQAFHLLNSLSDLMMLPFGMLVDAAIRKEVCPTFGMTLIKRVLDNFVPDDFSPNPIPQKVIAALASEEPQDASGKCLSSFPCSASATIYSPPSPTSVMEYAGEIGCRGMKKVSSSVLERSYFSDDDLTELDSPLSSIVIDNLHGCRTLAKSSWETKGNGSRNVIRYKLLREVMKEDEQ